MNKRIIQHDGYEMIYVETGRELGNVKYLDHICLHGNHKLFTINADYRPKGKSNNWYYVIAKSAKTAREKFKSIITFLNVYVVKEVSDSAEIDSVLSQPSDHIIL